MCWCSGNGFACETPEDFRVSIGTLRLIGPSPSQQDITIYYILYTLYNILLYSYTLCYILYTILYIIIMYYIILCSIYIYIYTWY